MGNVAANPCAPEEPLKNPKRNASEDQLVGSKPIGWLGERENEWKEGERGMMIEIIKCVCFSSPLGAPRARHLFSLFLFILVFSGRLDACLDTVDPARKLTQRFSRTAHFVRIRWGCFRDSLKILITSSRFSPVSFRYLTPQAFPWYYLWFFHDVRERERESEREKLFRDSFRDPPELTLRFRSSERGGRERMEKWLSRVSIASEEVIDAVTSSIDSCMSGLRYDFLGGERVHEELLQNPEGS